MVNFVNVVWLKIIPASIRNRIDQNPNFRAILSNIVWLFYDKALLMISGFLVGAWVARYLGPKQYGTLNYALAFVGLIIPLGQMGLKGVVIRNLVNFQKQKNQILGTTFFIQFFSGMVLIAILLYISSKVYPTDTLLVILILIISLKLVFQPISNIIEYWFDSQVQARYVVWSRNLVLIVTVSAKILLILFQAPLIAFAWVFAVDAVLLAFVLTYVYKKKSSDLLKFHFRLEQMSQLIKDSWPLMFSAFAVAIYMKIDQIMLGEITGSEELGYYAVAVRLSEVWYFIPMAIVSSFYPSIVRSLNANRLSVYHKKTQILFDIMAGSSYLIIVPLLLALEPIVLLLFGVEYSKSASILTVHIWAFLFVSLGVARTRILIAENRAKIDLFSTILGALLNIGLNLWFIPVYSGIGAAWATVVSYGFANYVSCLFFPQMTYLFKQMTLSLFIPVRLLYWRRYYVKFLRFPME